MWGDAASAKNHKRAHVDITLNPVVDVDNEPPLGLDPENGNLLENGSVLGKLLHRFRTLGRLLVAESNNMREQGETKPLGLVGGARREISDPGLDLLADGVS